VRPRPSLPRPFVGIGDRHAPFLPRTLDLPRVHCVELCCRLLELRRRTSRDGLHLLLQHLEHFQITGRSCAGCFRRLLREYLCDGRLYGLAPEHVERFEPCFLILNRRACRARRAHHAAVGARVQVALAIWWRKQTDGRLCRLQRFLLCQRCLPKSSEGARKSGVGVCVGVHDTKRHASWSRLLRQLHTIKYLIEAPRLEWVLVRSGRASVAHRNSSKGKGGGQSLDSSETR
jgi:hypothetical protein